MNDVFVYSLVSGAVGAVLASIYFVLYGTKKAVEKVELANDKRLKELEDKTNSMEAANEELIKLCDEFSENNKKYVSDTETIVSDFNKCKIDLENKLVEVIKERDANNDSEEKCREAYALLGEIYNIELDAAITLTNLFKTTNIKKDRVRALVARNELIDSLLKIKDVIGNKISLPDNLYLDKELVDKRISGIKVDFDVILVD